MDWWCWDGSEAVKHVGVHVGRAGGALQCGGRGSVESLTSTSMSGLAGGVARSDGVTASGLVRGGRVARRPRTASSKHDCARGNQQR